MFQRIFLLGGLRNTKKCIFIPEKYNKKKEEKNAWSRKIFNYILLWQQKFSYYMYTVHPTISLKRRKYKNRVGVEIFDTQNCCFLAFCSSNDITFLPLPIFHSLRFFLLYFIYNILRQYHNKKRFKEKGVANGS